jgi:hypothetical protein
MSFNWCCIVDMEDKAYHHGSGKIVIGCEIAAWASMPCDLVVFIVVYSF